MNEYYLHILLDVTSKLFIELIVYRHSNEVQASSVSFWEKEFHFKKWNVMKKKSNLILIWTNEWISHSLGLLHVLITDNESLPPPLCSTFFFKTLGEISGSYHFRCEYFILFVSDFCFILTGLALFPSQPLIQPMSVGGTFKLQQFGQPDVTLANHMMLSSQWLVNSTVNPALYNLWHVTVSFKVKHIV